MNLTKTKGLLFVFVGLLLVGLSSPTAWSALPKEDVIEVPAIGEGLCLHNLFQSNMVLQRDKPIVIWGWAAPDEKVTVTFAGQEQQVTAGKDRSWKVTLSALPANAKPSELTVKGEKQTLTLDNILIGDVWVLGGQSNMEFPISNVENGSLEIVSANFPNIRILTVPVQVGPEPVKAFARLDEWSNWSSRHFRKGDWNVCSPESVRELSAIGYVFARRLQMATQIPIGVIDVSRGGTTVETWTPDSVLRKLTGEPVKQLLAEWDEKVAAFDPKQDLADRVARNNQWIESQKKQGKPIPADRAEPPTDLRPGPAKDANRPGNCFAGMIAPIAGLHVKGVIFHQGFNNCFKGTQGALMYQEVFPQMIAAWRSAFDDTDLPFGILSLCTAGDAQTRDNFTESMLDVGAYIREAQYKTFLHYYEAGDKNIGFVSTYDLRRRWYHPQLKVPAGERIARWALATQYGFEKQVQWKPPMIKEMSVESGRIIIRFDGAVTPVDDGRPIEGFAIAGNDRRFHPADADFLVIGKDDRGRPRTDSTVIVLTSSMVPDPIHFRYAWARSPMGNLQTSRNTDVPLATQRSDDWWLEQVPAGVLGDVPPGEVDRGQRAKLQKALQLEDVKRRLKEAEDYIREHRQQVDAGETK